MASLVRKIYYGDDTWTAPAGVTQVTVSSLPMVNQTLLSNSSASNAMIAIDVNCDAYAWGANFCGQLGIGSITQQCLPTLVCCGLKWRTVGGGSGGNAFAGVTVSGDGYAWGNNSCGSLGNGSITTACLPTLICCGLKWKQITGRFGDAAAMLGITVQGDGYAWGDGQCGMLGNNSITTVCLPTPICCGFKWRQLGGGDTNAGNFSIGLTTTSDLYAWGTNTCGVSGIGSVSTNCQPTLVCCVLKWRSFSAGTGHVLAISSTCDLYAWGLGECGALGNNTTTTVCLPTPVCCGLKWRQVAAGQCTSLGITFDGDMYAWGSGLCGRLGIGSISSRCQPTLVCCGLKWRYVISNGISSFGISMDGDMYAWGSAACGVHGNGTITAACLPTLVCQGKNWLPLINSERKVFVVVPGTSYPIKVLARFSGFAGESVAGDVANEAIVLEYLA